ncbi:hypothetical protein CDD81_7643 [Ophiocordyceps australis]|uniref:RRM domain-containing protein n=1 Tax=Ophiocordyceps australis TaxID=1399860 RepID=A0A2C5X8Y3_9HYPO|nr:hypothetical protein CDD81_7643 [Ophiocordyceps australis]
MANKMDRGLDEIIADTRRSGPRTRRGGDGRRDRHDNYPRDGVRKSTREHHRGIDSEWVHDRYEDNNSRRTAPRRQREMPYVSEPRGSKLKAENIHYDLTEDDLDELFTRIGPVTRLQLLYDRAGRSEGTAFVTYESRDDAKEAIRQFDGANANGQPIYLSLLHSAPSRNPFDTAHMPSRPLAERISAPKGRSRSWSPHGRQDDDDEASSRKGIDRYTPGGARRSRSPMQRGRGGRRPGVRRDGHNRDEQSTRGGRANMRSKKTQDELDAEMEDYFAGNSALSAGADGESSNKAGGVAASEDVDMIG